MALTYSKLAAAYTGQKGQILNQVLRNELLFDVRSGTYIAFITTLLEEHGVNIIDIIADGLLRRRLDDTDTFSNLADVFELSQFHTHVRALSAAFASGALAQTPTQEQREVDKVSPSHEELARIQRAFYRYDIYCILFRPGDPGSVMYE